MAKTLDELKDVKGWVFDIQHYSIHDGPGIRTTVFFKGCPLSCLWCQNPESQQLKPQLFYIEDKCIKCGLCVKSCPEGAIELAEGKVKTNREICTACGKCIDVCPVQAREMIGSSMTAGEVLVNVLSDKIFYDESNGGVTISGGEVLFQPDFAEAILSLCKENGLHTAIETTGFASRSTLERILEHTDLVLYDIKHLSSREHEKGTGVPNGSILDNLKWISKTGVSELILRLPLIPGFNDDVANIEATAEFIANELNSSIKINLLPYHNMGEGKLNNLESPVKGFSSHAPSVLEMESVVKIFEKNNLTATIGG